MTFNPLKCGNFASLKKVKIEEDKIKISHEMAAPYIDEVHQKGVQLALNNTKCNRFLIFKLLEAMGVDFGTSTFLMDTIRFIHNGHHFRLDFDDVYEIVTLCLAEYGWVEVVWYRQLEFDYQVVADTLNGVDATPSTLTEVNTLYAHIHFRFYFILLRAAEKGISPDASAEEYHFSINIAEWDMCVEDPGKFWEV